LTGPLSGTTELIAIRSSDGTFLRADAGRWPIYSITKTFICAAIQQLALDIDRPASAWIDEHWLPQGHAISLRQLMNHTSGLTDYGQLPAYQRAIARGEAPWSDQVFADHTLRQPLLFKPGQGWSYSNPGYWLLTQIAEKASGLHLAELLSRSVLAPLGMRETEMGHGQFADDLPNYPAGWVWHGLLIASPADVATFMASPLAAGLTETPIEVPGRFPGWRAPHYGLGLMLEPGERYGHNGGGPGYSAASYHFPDRGVTICVLARTGEHGDEETAMRRLLELVDDLD
jgi:D-alanyl-D-alanine carboxypeptidase